MESQRTVDHTKEAFPKNICTYYIRSMTKAHQSSATRSWDVNRLLQDRSTRNATEVGLLSCRDPRSLEVD